MNMLKYELKSEPGKSIDVPVEYAGIASELVKLVVEEPDGFLNRMRDFSCLTNPGVFGRTKAVMANPSLLNQDALYLRACIFYRSHNGDTSNQALEWENDMIDVVRDVESQ